MTATDPQTTNHMSATAAPKPEDNRLVAKILITVVLGVTGWGLSIATWGIPGLYIPALAMVPIMMGILLLISRG